ncbi:tyrosyl-tRNA synthetase [Longilinea arvoryzae]|uniref:Tyrosine--tRNA ligase n=1 Tax=Longilinea arvoryzae TaxID=360412 RepID=A0A0S7BCS6_9CHLR|nr:tyrosine--tRNA ligase [Longilinea arvoryzae]GAP12576.1 tyrosyl-tRNA synthetase [Longilinea arvoryzae]
MSNSIFEELQWRGMVYDKTDGVQDLLAREKVTVYNGFDVTADSLHVGHIVPLVALARMQRFGHNPIALAGGGTTMVGDPSGKTSERTLMSLEAIQANTEAIKVQLAHFLDFETKINPARVLNNADWLASLNLIEFMRDIAKNFTVNYMLAKDSVRTRLEREEGLSFTEFTYMLLQSYDFLYLYDHYGCRLQTGGSEQWGNITAGVELVRRMRGEQAFGMVYPLITKADGTKFGKTESGAVWLDPKRTSPYRFYQFWLNTEDKDVVNYLKYFTFLEHQTIEDLAAAVVEHPEAREAQRRLASVMTQTMHGETALARAEQASQALFGGDISGLSAAEISDIFSDVPSCELSKTQLEGDGLPVADLLVSAGVAKSKGEARRSLQEGGIYINNRRVSDPNPSATLTDLLEGQFIVLRKGKKNYTLVKVIG